MSNMSCQLSFAITPAPLFPNVWLTGCLFSAINPIVWKTLWYLHTQQRRKMEAFSGMIDQNIAYWFQGMNTSLPCNNLCHFVHSMHSNCLILCNKNHTARIKVHANANRTVIERWTTQYDFRVVKYSDNTFKYVACVVLGSVSYENMILSYQNRIQKKSRVGP